MKQKLQTQVDVKGHVYTDDKAIDVDVLPPQQADGNATNQNNFSQQATLHASTVLLI